ncbi:hypothetical protein D3C87_76800 [compost metagenome]
MKIRGLDKNLENEIIEMMDMISVSASLLDYNVTTCYHEDYYISISVRNKKEGYFNESTREIIISFVKNSDGSKRIKTVRFLYCDSILSQYRLISKARKIKLVNGKFSKPVEKIIDSLGKEEKNYFG